MSQSNTSTTSNNLEANLSKPRGSYAIRKILVDRFPVFRGKGKAKLPLKIGIDKDICQAAPDLTRREIARALAEYTRGPTAAVGATTAILSKADQARLRQYHEEMENQWKSKPLHQRR